jgi:oligopeptide transport system substrate-binding protein
LYRNLAIIAAGCLACLVVFRLSFTGDARTRADFVWNNNTEPQTLDPLRMSGQPESALALTLFEGLTVYHPKTIEPTPGVAHSWSVDSLTYTFHLRHDSWWVRAGEIVQTSEGPRAVTAEDFLYTWRAHALPETGSQYGYLFHIIAGYEDYKKAVEVQWKNLTGRYGPSRSIVGPQDLDPHDLSELNELRDSLWRETVGARALDEFTLEVRLHAAAPYFSVLTSFPTFFPVPREAIEEHGDAWMLPQNIMTNGAYQLKSWRFNAYIRLVKNPFYWESEEYVAERMTAYGQLTSPSPARAREYELQRTLGSFAERGLQTIEALAVEERNTSLNLYLNGDVDRIDELPATIVGELIDASRSEVGLPHLHHAAQMIVYFYNLNLKHPAFQGETGWKLRRALALSVDREGLIRTVTREGQAPAYGMVPPGVPGYPQRHLVGTGDHATDLAEAKRLFAEVRDKGGSIPKLRLLYNTSENHAKIAAFIQAGWRDQLGLECDLTNQEWGVFLESRSTGNFDIARMGWIGDYPDANTFLDLFTRENPNNDPGYENSFFDRLILEYAAHVDDILRSDERRAALLSDLRAQAGFRRRLERELKAGAERGTIETAIETFLAAAEVEKPQAAFLTRRLLLELAEEILMHDVPTIPIFFYTRAQLWPPELEGIHTNLIDVHPAKFLRWRNNVRPAGSRYKVFPRFRA